MMGLYFSGTGNTKYVLELFLKKLHKSNYTICSIEENHVVECIKQAKEIVIAYPIYYSSLPKIVNDFIDINIELFRDKKIFIITTMGLFSGDGSGLTQRKLRKVNANIIGGLHIKMPDIICDVNLLKKSKTENANIINQANISIDNAVSRIKKGLEVRQGLSSTSHIAGLLGQRLYFGHHVKKYSDKIKIDNEKCTKCNKCVSLCPMENLVLDDRVHTLNKCTMCYRCLNLCPAQAITLIGKKMVQQYHIQDYLE